MDTTPKTTLKNKNSKKKNKNNLLLCFRPIFMECLEKPSQRKDGPVFTYIAVGEKEGVVFPRILKAVDKERQQEEEIEKGSDRRKKGGNGRFSRLLKAVLFETSLAKKIMKRKLGQNSLESKTDQISKPEKFSNPVKETSMYTQFPDDNNNNQRNNSNASSSCHCSSVFTLTSSCCSSCSSSRTHSNSRTSSRRIKSSLTNSIGSKQRQDNNQEHGKKEKECYGSNTGFWFLLISLLVLILWGKVCAILCTSAWFFMVARWSGRYDQSPANEIKSVEIDSEEYKKKVIMEGLLQRSHSRGVYLPFRHSDHMP